MQAILCVDASTEPAALQVLRVDARTLELVESRSASLGKLFLSPNEIHPENTDEIPTESTAQHSDAEMSSSRHEDHQMQPTNELQAALQSIETPWTASVLVIPTPAYLSLNVELPFGDPKNLAKILDLEIQDRVPFDVSEFLIDYRTLGKSPSGMYDIHVSLIPKTYIAKILSVCRESGLEPFILTTPASVLDALFFIAPDYFRGDCAIAYLSPDSAAVSIRFDGITKADRMLLLSPTEDNNAIQPSEALRALLADLKLTISAAESRYDRQTERVYLVGPQISPQEAQQILGRQVELIDIADAFKNKPSDARPSAMAAVFAQDIAPPPLLTNFRTREFTYNVQLRELLLGMRRVVPYAIAALVCLFFFLGGRFALRQYQVSMLEDALHERLGKLIPDAQIEPGKEVEWLLNQNFKLQNDLKDLGSPSKYSALDLLSQLTKDFPVVTGVNVREVLIQGNVIKLSGTAPDYTAQERIEKALKSSNNNWKVSSKDAPGGIGGGANARPFSFEIRLLE